MVQNDKKLSITLHISRITHYMIVIYGLLWGKRAKNGHKWQKIMSVKNGPKWQKTVHHASYLKNHLLYDCHLWGKRVKMVINDKKFCLFCSMSQELYAIWSSFMVLVHIFKMIISPGFFSCFQNFDFPGCYWGSTKKLSKMTKKFVWDTPYPRNHTWYDCHLWYTCVKW